MPYIVSYRNSVNRAKEAAIECDGTPETWKDFYGRLYVAEIGANKCGVYCDLGHSNRKSAMKFDRKRLAEEVAFGLKNDSCRDAKSILITKVPEYDILGLFLRAQTDETVFSIETCA